VDISYEGEGDMKNIENVNKSK